MDYSKELCLTWIASAGLPPMLLRSLLQSEMSPIQIFTRFQQHGSFTSEIPLSVNMVTTLKQNSSPAVMNMWKKKLSLHHIHVMTAMDACFPERLREIPDSPEILFYQGSLSALERNTVAVVGSRNASRKGLEAARSISEKLSERGIGIVSGLAYGIDTAAHQGCLQGGSPTIAVMGCGLDMDYPAENAGLRKEILSHEGLILSEYAPGEKPLGWHFPWRNRIISALGDCLAVMEARIRSGSMTSVHHALEQGKDVFVYPGDPGSPRSEGNHQLIREGAIYFTCAEDLTEDMGWLDKTEDVRQNNGHDNMEVHVSPLEKKVLDELEAGERSFEQLLDVMGIPASALNASLSMLQIQGLIKALPGKRFEKTV